MGEISKNKFSKDETLKAKCIAIMLLIFHHMYLSADNVIAKVEMCGVDARIISNMARDARFCVWIFVFLSAYGMAVSFEKYEGSKMAFFWHRVLMLQKFALPILFLYYVLAIISGQTGGVFEKAWYVVFNILGLSDMFDIPNLGGGYWYITFTILLSLFFFFFYEICKKYKYLSILMTIVLWGGGYISWGIHSSSGGYYVQYFIAVLIGILFAQNRVWDKIGKINTWQVKMVSFVVIFVCVLFMPYIRNTYFVEEVWMIKQILMTIPAICVCCFTFIFCRASWLSRSMVWIGKHSANMYLLHPLVLQYLDEFVYVTRNVLVSYFTCFVISLLLSMLIEKVLSLSGYNDFVEKVDGKVCEKL